MKILILHHCDDLGGAGISAIICAQMLMDSYDVTICVPHINSIIGQEISQIDGLKIRSTECELGMINAYSGGPSVFGASFIKGMIHIILSKKNIKNLIETEEYDLVICNSMTLCWIPWITNKCHFLCYIRETKRNDCGFKLIRKLLNKNFKYVIFISEFDKQEMHLKVPYQYVIRNSMIGNFADNSKSIEFCKDFFKIPHDSVINVLFVGGTEAFKGYDLAIDVFKSYLPRGIRLIVAGNIDEDRKVIAENIYYVGRILNIGLLYQAVDFLIFPAIKPHQARPAFEIGFYKKPVIISMFKEVMDEVNDGYNGLLFAPGDKKDLAQKILILAQDKNLRIQLGKNNYEKSMKYHNYENNKKILLNIIARIEDEK